MKSQSKLAKLFSVKLLFIFSLVFVFSFSTQINFSHGQEEKVRCYLLKDNTLVEKSTKKPISGIKCDNYDIEGFSGVDGDYEKASCSKSVDGTIVNSVNKVVAQRFKDYRCTSVVERSSSSSTTPDCTSTAVYDQNGYLLSGSIRGDCVSDTTTGGTTNTVTGQYTPAPSDESKNFCSDIPTIEVAKKTGCYVVYSFMEVALQINAVFAKLSSSMFDTLTQKFVLQISTLFKNQDGTDGKFIYGGWSVIRDLANIAAFFGAVYTGFRYITGSDSLDFKKAVTKLILYSILVNFSFPIAKFLIDISNVITLQIYGGITEYQVGSGNLSNMILSRMGAVSMLVSDVGSASTKFSGFSSFSVMFLAIVYLFSIFLVFIYAAIMIAARSFILLACVIFSPLMFLNFAFPKLTEIHEKWRENFFGQLMFAPILMIGFWLSFILMSAATTGTDALATFNSTSSSASSGKEVTDIINMTLAIIALFMTVKIAGSVSGGAGKAVSGFVGGGMKNLGLAAVTGGAGLAFRQTVGRAGAAMANSNWIKNGKGGENGALRRMSSTLLGNVGTRASNFKLAGTKSFDEKRSGNVKGAKDEARDQHGQSLKDTGLTDQLGQAKTEKEVQMVMEEMARIKADPNHKRNEDLFGRNAKQKASDLNQSTLKEARLGNVSGANRKEFIALKNGGTKEESPEAKKLREEKIESLKNTSKVAAASNAVGGFMGDMARDAKGVLLENPLSQGIGNYAAGVKDRTVGMLNDIGEKLNSPSVIGTIGRGVADGFRGKRSSSQSVAAEGSSPSQTSVQAAEPKQTVATNAVTGASSRG